MLNVSRTIISLAGAFFLRTVICHPYTEYFDDLYDNSLSPPYYPPASPYAAATFDASAYPPVKRFPDADEGDFCWCPRYGSRKHLRPPKMAAAPRQIIYRNSPPVIIEHKPPKPPPTILSPIGTLINSFVKSIFPQMSYYDDY